jgi:acyl-CoA oxidase
MLGLIKFVAEQVVETVAERTATRRLAARVREPEVTDAGWHRDLFADREAHLLGGLARRLRRATAPGADAFAVFNAAQDHLLTTARAYVERRILDSFDAAVRRCPDEGVKALLDRVRALYALTVLEADRAWFLEHGRLTPARSKAVISAVNQLCGELREYAEVLVEGFGIPEAWLDAQLLAAPRVTTESAGRRG